VTAWKNIIVHHSASDWGTARVIDGWHKQRGWSGIGYHFVILNGFTNYEDRKRDRCMHSLIGSIETGRPINLDPFISQSEVGAHALGFNKNSIGICLIHRDGAYHANMYTSLIELLDELVHKFGIDPVNIKGHYEVDAKKPHCPGIDMRIIRDIIGHVEKRKEDCRATK